MNKFEKHRFFEQGGDELVRSMGTGWSYESMKTPTGRKPYRTGCGMASDERASFFPERAQRRVRGETDPLVRKPLYALGEAGKRGWARVIWESQCARVFYRAKILAAFDAHHVLPLPG